MPIAFTEEWFFDTRIEDKKLSVNTEVQKSNFSERDRHETYRILFFRQKMKLKKVWNHLKAIKGYLPYNFFTILAKIAHFSLKMRKYRYKFKWKLFISIVFVQFYGYKIINMVKTCNISGLESKISVVP